MIIGHAKTEIHRVSDVVIPKAFFCRMHTGISQFDALYGGEGILPGSVGTIAAAPGAGKTTLLLQLCEALSNQGYKAAYLTGEESIEMLAYTCRRLKIDNVYVGSKTEIDEIISVIEEMDFVVYDSFPCLTNKGKRLSRNEQEEAISKLVSASKKHETATCFILHITKNGTYKGSTTIPHAVDINMEISIDDDDPLIRVLTTSKNRYGSLAEIYTHFGFNGFDFSVKVEPKETSKASSKSKRKDEELAKIKALKEPPGLTVPRVCKELNIDATRAGYLLRALVSEGVLVKYGRGDQAVWKHVEYANKV